MAPAPRSANPRRWRESTPSTPIRRVERVFALDTAAPPDTPWLDNLNPEQRAAATHQGRDPLLILAGAGTGKTTTLCSRVASLVHAGVAPERILLLTFTRRASRDMLTRAEALSRGASRRVVGGTFHSVAHRFVRAHAAALGLSADFGLLDPGDVADVIDLVRSEQGHGSEQGRRFPRKHTLADIYSRTVNAQRPLREVLDEAFPWCDEHAEALAQLFRGYTARKRALGVLDLDDLLLHWRAMVGDEELGRHVAGAFDHVLVDEYQDVNGVQVDIVRSLGRHGCAVTAVGDDFQAIYSFRSASAGHILGFPDQFPRTRVVTLERNYRSTQPLLDVANAVSAQDERGFRKVLRAQREGGARPELVFSRDQAAEAVEVCDRVLAAREAGMLLREQAVLARTGHDSEALELELARRRIPFVKYGGLKFLEAAHVKDLLGILRWADNAKHRLAGFRSLQLLPGVGPWTAAVTAEAAWGDADAVAVGDFHLPNTVCWALAREPRGTDARMLELLEPYRGHRARVARLLLDAHVHAPRRGPRLSVSDFRRR